MARPLKNGLDYFPHDCDAMNDEKIEALTLLYGAKGYIFYFGLLERIYRTPNQELDITAAETLQILSRKLTVTQQEFAEILQTALNLGCFDRRKYESEQILTSNGIKKRSNAVIEKRVKTRKSYQKQVSAAEIPQETPPETPQSKVKESKVKESKVKESKVKESKGEESKRKNIKAFIPPRLEEIETYIAENHYNVDAKKFFEYFSESGWIDAKGQKVKSWKQKIITWSSYGQKPTQQARRDLSKSITSQYGTEIKTDEVSSVSES